MVAAVTDRAPLTGSGPAVSSSAPSSRFASYSLPQDRYEQGNGSVGSVITLAGELVEGAVGCGQRLSRFVAGSLSVSNLGKLALDGPPMFVSWLLDDERPWC